MSCSLDRTHGLASLICEYHDSKFNDIFSDDVFQRCQDHWFSPTDSELLCSNCQNIY